jgi:hypothetical protein
MADSRWGCRVLDGMDGVERVQQEAAAVQLVRVEWVLVAGAAQSQVETRF